jgi:hypothetical protein
LKRVDGDEMDLAAVERVEEPIAGNDRLGDAVLIEMVHADVVVAARRVVRNPGTELRRDVVERGPVCGGLAVPDEIAGLQDEVGRAGEHLGGDVAMDGVLVAGIAIHGEAQDGVGGSSRDRARRRRCRARGDGSAGRGREKEQQRRAMEKNRQRVLARRV